MMSREEVEGYGISDSSSRDISRVGSALYAYLNIVSHS
jgi:hypothetical protein